MLRIIVFGLLVANILLITLRLLQPEAADSPVAPIGTESGPLPTIELADEVPPPEADMEEPAGVELRNLATASVSDIHGCIRFGPFDSGGEAAALQPELQELFDGVRARETNSIIETGYWVFLPPFTTQPEAEQAMARLAAAGASDLYVVPRGQLANAVSLGTYDRRAPAKERREQLEALDPGLEIAIQLQTEVETRFWLDAGPVDALNPVLIQLSLSHPDVQQMQVQCGEEMANFQVN